MRLGFINIWGKGKTPVQQVHLTYDENTYSLQFTQEADKEVSGLRKYFFKWSYSKLLHGHLIFLSPEET